MTPLIKIITESNTRNQLKDLSFKPDCATLNFSYQGLEIPASTNSSARSAYVLAHGKTVAPYSKTLVRTSRDSPVFVQESSYVPASEELLSTISSGCRSSLIVVRMTDFGNWPVNEQIRQTLETMNGDYNLISGDVVFVQYRVGGYDGADIEESKMLMKRTEDRKIKLMLEVGTHKTTKEYAQELMKWFNSLK